MTLVTPTEHVGGRKSVRAQATGERRASSVLPSLASDRDPALNGLEVDTACNAGLGGGLGLRFLELALAGAGEQARDLGQKVAVRPRGSSTPIPS